MIHRSHFFIVFIIISKFYFVIFSFKFGKVNVIFGDKNFYASNLFETYYNKLNKKRIIFESVNKNLRLN